MYKNYKILGFIPARAGSKGLKDKNILDLAGKPLIAWTIDAAKKSKYIDRVIISTDGENVADIAKNAGGEVPFLRPKKFAKDNTPLTEPINHCLDWIKQNESASYDYILALQPTSPLRGVEHIDSAIEYYFKNKKTHKDTLVSVMPMPKKMGWLMDKKNKLYINFCFADAKKNNSRQNLVQRYMPNGAIYFSLVQYFRKFGFYGDNVIAYEMNPDISIDIDTLEDFDKAERILKTRKSNNNKLLR